LKADRSHDPFEDIGLDLGDLGLELRQIRLGGKIVMRCFPQGLGERLRLLGRKMSFVPQRPGQAKGIEKNCTHQRNMKRDELKVHQRGVPDLNGQIATRCYKAVGKQCGPVG
jgi:hypothetical protein